MSRGTSTGESLSRIEGWTARKARLWLLFLQTPDVQDSAADLWEFRIPLGQGDAAVSDDRAVPVPGAALQRRDLNAPFVAS